MIEAELKLVEEENATLREAAQSAIDRWETPLWKDAEPTAKAIYRLRDALEACSGGPHQKYRDWLGRVSNKFNYGQT